MEQLSNRKDLPLPQDTPSELKGPRAECDEFHLFTRLPVEIRIKIYEAALTPRIINCRRTNNQNIFTGPPTSIPLFCVSQESRETAFRYGLYDLVSTSPSMVYFSPIIDYLWFDVAWIPLPRQGPPLPPPRFAPHVPPPRHDFSDSLPAHLLSLRNVMVHPNWSDERMRPTTQIAKFPDLKRILVAADERSIGIHSQVMMDTMYDMKMYFTVAKQQDAEVQMPDIAVGCLGWTNSDGRKLYHAREDNRQLVGIFENYTTMKDHQEKLREQEWRFTRDRFATSKPSIVAKLERAMELSEKGVKLEGWEALKTSSNLPRYDDEDAERQFLRGEPPTYDDAVATTCEASASSCSGDSIARNSDD